MLQSSLVIINFPLSKIMSKILKLTSYYYHYLQCSLTISPILHELYQIFPTPINPFSKGPNNPMNRIGARVIALWTGCFLVCGWHGFYHLNFIWSSTTYKEKFLSEKPRSSQVLQPKIIKISTVQTKENMEYHDSDPTCHCHLKIL